MHRGIALGALMGAHCGERAIPEHLKTGLKDHEALRGEIEAFKAAVASDAAM